MKNPIERLADLGQSVWYDYIRRDLFDGELRRLLDAGLRGMTSNPTIFEKAIAGTQLYDDAIGRLGPMPPRLAFEALAIEDVRAAADAFRPVHAATAAVDGMVSIEVDPRLAHDTNGSVAEAHRLSQLVARPNVMIKIPGTREGVPAIRRALAAGLPINVTLVFSNERYAEVIDAYLGALEERLSAGRSIEDVRSVASFFVSRVDTLADRRLDALAGDAGRPQRDRRLARDLRGRVAIANAKLAYEMFERAFRDDPRFARLEAEGAKVQRPLWASTSTKDPSYPELLYVDALVAPDSIDTMPPSTFEACLEHGDPHVRIRDDLEAARDALRSLAALGIDARALARRLEDEGVAKFASSYDAAVAAVAQKQARGAGAMPAPPA